MSVNESEVSASLTVHPKRGSHLLLNAKKSSNVRTSTTRSIIRQCDKKVNLEWMKSSLHFCNKITDMVIRVKYFFALNAVGASPIFIREQCWRYIKNRRTTIAVRLFHGRRKSGVLLDVPVQGFCLKSNMPIRSPSAGRFSGTYGFFLSVTGFGRLSRLRLDNGASFQLRWMNFRIDA